MKKYILPFMSIAMLMAMASCSSSDDEVTENNAESKLVQMTFTATQETNTDTRTALSDAGNYVIWKQNDAISVFDGNGDQKFTLVGDGGDTSGSFTGTASSEATEYYAVYPCKQGATLEFNESLECSYVDGITLPAVQKATNGSFDPSAALMMAYSTGETKNQLGFKNVVSLVKVTTGFACKKIVLSASTDIAGTGGLYYNNDAPYIDFTSNKSNSVTLVPAEGETEIAAGTYYISVRPGNYSFSISFDDSNEYCVYTRNSSGAKTFTRSKIKDFGTFTTGGTWTNTSRGIVEASQEVDLGLTITKEGGKTYRVIFAKSNLTANGLAANESDFGDFYAWGATEPWYTSYSISSDGKPNVGDSDWKPSYSGGYTGDNYNTYISGKTLVDNSFLKMEYDAARQKLGGDWQIPTKEILEKLLEFSQATVEIDGIQGSKISNNGTYIFLPFAGHFFPNWEVPSVEKVVYWSNYEESNSNEAYGLLMFGDFSFVDVCSRYCGNPIRPVRLVEVDN